MSFIGKFFKKQYSSFIFGVIKYGCIVHLTNEYVVDVVLCYGPSMEPTLFSDNIILCEHLTPLMKKIKKGDIVIAKSITNPKKFVCKRVVGLEGEFMWSGTSYDLIPKGHVWLQGDNSFNSTDSRNYGSVPYALIRGRVIAKLWPFNEMCWLTASEQESDTTF